MISFGKASLKKLFSFLSKYKNEIEIRRRKFTSGDFLFF